MENRVAKVWIYNTTIVQGEPHILLAERFGYEKAFWHLTSGGITVPGNSALPGEAAIIQEARQAVLREATLRTRLDAEITLMFVDRTSHSDWAGAPVAHVLIDHGPLDALLPVKPAIIETPSGPRGTVDLKWAKLRDFDVASQPRTDVNPAAHPHVFYRDLALRSMVAKVIGASVMPRLLRTYGPFRNLPNLIGPVVTAQPERSPGL